MERCLRYVTPNKIGESNAERELGADRSSRCFYGAERTLKDSVQNVLDESNTGGSETSFTPNTQ